jgi:hypothetical protein
MVPSTDIRVCLRHLARAEPLPPLAIGAGSSRRILEGGMIDLRAVVESDGLLLPQAVPDVLPTLFHRHNRVPDILQGFAYLNGYLDGVGRGAMLVG